MVWKAGSFQIFAPLGGNSRLQYSVTVTWQYSPIWPKSHRSLSTTRGAQKERDHVINWTGVYVCGTWHWYYASWNSKWNKQHIYCPKDLIFLICYWTGQHEHGTVLQDDSLVSCSSCDASSSWLKIPRHVLPDRTNMYLCCQVGLLLMRVGMVENLFPQCYIPG